MSSNQKRWLTNKTSKLAKADLLSILRKKEAWMLLPEETRQHLYNLLPAAQDHEPSHDINVHPLNSHYKEYIEGELRRWQDDLCEGRESGKWREDAMLAGRERVEGKWTEWMRSQKDELWGNDNKAKVDSNGDSDGDRDNATNEGNVVTMKGL